MLSLVEDAKSKDQSSPVPARSLRVRFRASRSAVSHKLQQEKIEEICVVLQTLQQSVVTPD
jgi:hypothetical protein